MASTIWSRIIAVLFSAMLMAGCATLGEKREADTALRFAVLGDAEPKPEPAFPGVDAAVRDVNSLAERGRIDFVVGIGDLAHKGTVVQYENITPILQRLIRPFYPIMGNEEHNESLERYLDYAGRWNPDVKSPRYVQDHGPITMIYASPDFGRDFNDEGIEWIVEQLRGASKPVFLVIHGAQVGVYPENPDKGVKNERFAEITAEPNLAAVISGDLHMDMDRVQHSKRIGRVHYLHMPALERTKIPDESRHIPMYRVFTISDRGEVKVETFQTGDLEPLERHTYRFSIAD